MHYFPDPALQTGHFICYSHRTYHLLPTHTGIKHRAGRKPVLTSRHSDGVRIHRFVVRSFISMDSRQRRLRNPHSPLFQLETAAVLPGPIVPGSIGNELSR